MILTMIAKKIGLAAGFLGGLLVGKHFAGKKPSPATPYEPEPAKPSPGHCHTSGPNFGGVYLPLSNTALHAHPTFVAPLLPAVGIPLISPFR